MDAILYRKSYYNVYCEEFPNILELDQHTVAWTPIFIVFDRSRNFVNQFEKDRNFTKIITIRYIMEMLWNSPVARMVEILQKIYQYMCDMLEY